MLSVITVIMEGMWASKSEKWNHPGGDRRNQRIGNTNFFFCLGFFCSFFVINDCVQCFGPKKKTVHTKKSEEQVLIAWKTPAGLNVSTLPTWEQGLMSLTSPTWAPGQTLFKLRSLLWCSAWLEDYWYYQKGCNSWEWSEAVQINWLA